MLKSFSIKLFVYALFGFAICALIYNLSCKQDSGLNRLAADFKSANQSDSIESMLKLYCLDGIDTFSITRLRGVLEYELGIPIKQIQFEPLTGAPEETIEFVHDEIMYEPSLAPLYRMRVTYIDENHFTSLYTIGKDSSGTWKIITAKPQLSHRD